MKRRVDLVGRAKKLVRGLKRLLELHSSGMPVADAVKLLNQRLSDPGQKEIAGVLWKELAEGKHFQIDEKLATIFL